jgi:quercetin dioxygenase-like cupin family protein
MSKETHVVGPDGLTSFESPMDEEVVVRATGEETGGSYDLIEFVHPPGPGTTPMHVHHDNDEAMLVLEGELTVQLGADRHVLEPGSYAMAERGVPHTYRNSGDGPARVLFILSPGNGWGYLQETAEAGPVEDESDMERMLPILESYGVEVVGPPLDGDDDTD